MLMLSHEGIKEIHNVNVALTCSMSVIKGRHKSYDTIKDAIRKKKYNNKRYIFTQVSFMVTFPITYHIMDL